MLEHLQPILQDLALPEQECMEPGYLGVTQFAIDYLGLDLDLESFELD